eukprot:CAMPEP_0184306870 /NCGR_PEP_ID=MMETSP1049-20130417/15752_1 /TAXON_ID=77928 /ORGANISM="Proteomonas sulcata, Strain CCMP704" /LENGTH=348 /DNA_ID=CAMNT_0026619225 /DNA_START=325 /DNA_END=1371 /DNA_ORIENTATION=-
MVGLKLVGTRAVAPFLLVFCCAFPGASSWFLSSHLPAPGSLGGRLHDELIVRNRAAIVPSLGRLGSGELSLQSPMRHGKTGLRMGIEEWKNEQPGPARRLGCLPFPPEDLLLPGETKNLHLYEARFLALFEEAVKSHGSCFGNCIFAGNMEFLNIAAPLVEIIEWRRQDVGIFVKVRCVGRVKIEDVEEGDPYLIVTATPYDDEAVDAEDLKFLTDEVYQAHAHCVVLQEKLMVSASDPQLQQSESWEWGHETTDTSGAFKDSLYRQLQTKQEVLHSDPDLPISQQEQLISEIELLSFVAIRGFDPEDRLLALNLQNTGARLMRAKHLLEERQKILTAKAALMGLDLK